MSRSKAGMCLLLVLLSAGPLLAGGYCGHAVVTYQGYGYHAPSYNTYQAPNYSYNYPNYYQAPTYYSPAVVKEYIPYPIEVQVYKDRAYSLSELYRDRLFLEMWDQMKEATKAAQVPGTPGYSGRQAAAPAVASAAPAAVPGDGVVAPPARAAARQVVARTAPTSKEAAKVLKEKCFVCHGKGNEHMDLSDPDLVSTLTRRAAFGMVMSTDMPPPPKELREPGKEKELKEWREEHALKEEEIQAIYSGWVSAPLLVKK